MMISVITGRMRAMNREKRSRSRRRSSFRITARTRLSGCTATSLALNEGGEDLIHRHRHLAHVHPFHTGPGQCIDDALAIPLRITSEHVNPAAKEGQVGIDGFESRRGLAAPGAHHLQPPAATSFRFAPARLGFPQGDYPPRLGL